MSATGRFRITVNSLRHGGFELTIDAGYSGELRQLGAENQRVFVGKRSSMNFAKHVGPQALVDANRVRLSTQIGCQIQWLKQVHGTAIYEVPKSEANDANVDPTADAAITSKSGIALAIMTADCLPVMFADRRGRLVGAAHAGWRGLLGGVLDKTLEIFLQRGIQGEEIAAYIGPSIGVTAFEVGDEVRLAFLKAAKLDETLATQAAFVANGAGRWLANLSGLAAIRLRRYDVELDQELVECTYSNPANYFSYRYFCHHPEGEDGRQVTLIWMDRLVQPR
jgi:polyphenol oxidase